MQIIYGKPLLFIYRCIDDSEEQGFTSSDPVPTSEQPGRFPQTHSQEDMNLFDCDQPIDDTLFEPLYLNSNVTICGAYFSIMHFATQNKLSYTAINHLLDLLRLFCPKPNSIPSSFYVFKKFFKNFSGGYSKQSYCADCETMFEGKSCTTQNCSSSGGMGHLIQIPIKKALQAIVSSKLI